MTIREAKMKINKNSAQYYADLLESDSKLSLVFCVGDDFFKDKNYFYIRLAKKRYVLSNNALPDKSMTKKTLVSYIIDMARNIENSGVIKYKANRISYPLEIGAFGEEERLEYQTGEVKLCLKEDKWRIFR